MPRINAVMPKDTHPQVKQAWDEMKRVVNTLNDNQTATGVANANNGGSIVAATSSGVPTITNPPFGTIVVDTTGSFIWVYTGTWKKALLT